MAEEQESNEVLTDELKAALKAYIRECLEAYLFRETESWSQEIMKLRKKRNELQVKVAKMREELDGLKQHVGYEHGEGS